MFTNLLTHLLIITALIIAILSPILTLAGYDWLRDQAKKFYGGAL